MRFKRLFFVGGYKVPQNEKEAVRRGKDANFLDKTGGRLHVVVQETILSHLLVLRARSAVVGVRINADAAPGDKDAGHLNILRFHQANEVLHDDVDTVLMEAAVVAEAEKVELETLALHHPLVGQVADAYLSKVRLSGNGTKGRELRAIEANPIVVFGMFVLESLQHVGGIVLWNLSLLAKGLQAFFFSV